MEDNKVKTKFEHFCDFLIRIAYLIIFCSLLFLIFGTYLDLDFIPRTSNVYPQSLIIICLAFIFTLLLSKKYESISIFKILELKKSLKESKDINIGLEKKNSELLSHIVSISNTHIQSQSQGVINVNGTDIESLKQLLGVVQISNEEKRNQEEEEQVIQEIEENRKSRRDEIERIRQTESVILDAILKDKPESMKEVKFNNFMYNDPIAKDIRTVFDGYYKTFEEEVFVEIVLGKLWSALRFDRLYHMLNKIYLYRQIKNTNIYLRLVLLNLENEDSKVYISKKRIEQYFENAIRNGLLTVEIFGENEQFFQQQLIFNQKEQ